jgi:hypothetical protein
MVQHFLVLTGDADHFFRPVELDQPVAACKGVWMRV